MPDGDFTIRGNIETPGTNEGPFTTGSSTTSAPPSVINVTVNAQGAMFDSYESRQRLADRISEALIGRAELRGRFAFGEGGV
jgi:hypothetical protein